MIDLSPLATSVLREHKEKQQLERAMLGAILKDDDLLINKVIVYLKQIAINKIVKKLPGFDCKKCGYTTCEQLATGIFSGYKNLKDCKVLEDKMNLKIQLFFNKVAIPLQPFVSRIIRSTILGMVSSLKDVSIVGDEKLLVEISK